MHRDSGRSEQRTRFWNEVSPGLLCPAELPFVFLLQLWPPQAPALPPGERGQILGMGRVLASLKEDGAAQSKITRTHAPDTCVCPACWSVPCVPSFSLCQHLYVSEPGTQQGICACA